MMTKDQYDKVIAELQRARGDESVSDEYVQRLIGAAKEYRSQNYTPDLSGPSEPAAVMEKSFKELGAPWERANVYESPSGEKSVEVPQSAPPKEEKQKAPGHYYPASLGGVGELPGFLPGGKVEYFTEPPIEQFHADMRKAYGSGVTSLGKSSPEYREYAQNLWEQQREHAIAGNYGAVRLSEAGYGPRDLAARGVAGLGSVAAGVGKAFASVPNVVAERAMTQLGNPEAATEMGRVHAASPNLEAAGQIGGMLMPFSPGMLGAEATGAIGRAALPTLAKAATKPGIAGGLLRAAGAGAKAAGGAVADVGARDVVEPPFTQEGAPYTPEQEAKRLGSTALLAAPFGAGFDVLGGAAGIPGMRLRHGVWEEGAQTRPPGIPELVPAEAAGGRTSLTRRFVPGEPVVQARNEAMAAGKAPEDFLVGQLASDVERGGRDLSAKVGGEIRAENAAYERLPQARTAQPVDNAYNALKKVVNEAYPKGEEIPIISQEPSYASRIARAKKQFASISDVTLVEANPPGSRTGPATQALRAARYRGKGVPSGPADKLTIDEAQRMGIDVEGLLRQEAAKQGYVGRSQDDWVEHNLALGEGFNVITSPKQLPLSQQQTISRELDALVNWKAANKEPSGHEMQVAAALKADRGAFGEAGPAAGRTATLPNGEVVTGVEAMKALQGQKKAELEATLRASSLPEKLGNRRLGEEQRRALESAVAAYETGGGAGRDEAIRRLAELGGGSPEQLIAERATASLENKGKGGGGHLPLFLGSPEHIAARAAANAISRGARLRLDAALGTLASQGDVPLELRGLLGPLVPLASPPPLVPNAMLRPPGPASSMNPLRLRGGRPGRIIASLAAEQAEGAPPSGLTPEELDAIQLSLGPLVFRPAPRLPFYRP